MEAKNKKIGLIILAILIIAGIAVVALKGFNVSLYLREHQTLKYKFDVAFKKDDIEKVCSEVFGDKEYEARTVESFNDSVYIISPTITEKEENKLVEKLSALYTDKTDNTEDEKPEYDIYTDGNIRIRDLLKPYILPTIISAVIIIIVSIIRYKVLKLDKVFVRIFKMIFEVIIVLFVLLSIIAILRIPVNTWIFPGLMFLCLAYIVAKFEKEVRN